MYIVHPTLFIEGLFFQLFLSDSSLDTWSTEHERMVPSVWIILLHQPFWTAPHVKCEGKRRLFTEVWTWYQCLAWPMMGRLVFEPVNLHDLLAPANFASFAQEPSLAGWQQKSPICTNILHRKQGLCVYWETHRQSERRIADGYLFLLRSPLDPRIDFVLCVLRALRTQDTWCMKTQILPTY